MFASNTFKLMWVRDSKLAPVYPDNHDPTIWRAETFCRGGRLSSSFPTMYDAGYDTPQNVLYRELEILDRRCSTSNGGEGKRDRYKSRVSLSSSPTISNCQKRPKGTCCIPSLVPWRALQLLC